MFGLGTWEMVIILVAALIFIGPGKLPELARSLGKGMREIKRAVAGFESEARQAVHVPSQDDPQADEGAPEDQETIETSTASGERELPEVQEPEAPRVAAGQADLLQKDEAESAVETTPPKEST